MTSHAVYSYNHNNRIGATVRLSTETELLARSATLKHLGEKLAMHLATLDPDTEWDFKETTPEEGIGLPTVPVAQMLASWSSEFSETIDVTDWTLVSKSYPAAAGLWSGTVAEGVTG